MDILGYLKNTHKNPKFGRVRQIPIWELGWELGFVSLSQIWDFCGYSLNTLKYPKLGMRYFFLWADRVQRNWTSFHLIPQNKANINEAFSLKLWVFLNKASFPFKQKDRTLPLVCDLKLILEMSSNSRKFDKRSGL